MDGMHLKRTMGKAVKGVPASSWAGASAEETRTQSIRSWYFESDFFTTWVKRRRVEFKRMSDTVRVTPSVLAVPGILFVILLTVGCWAVVWSSNKRDNFILSDTVVMASTTVSALEYSLSMGHLPALMLASYVREVPNWQELQPRFVRMGTNIMSQINMEPQEQDQMASAIRLIPFGYIAATVPVDEAHAAQETGLSIFSEPLLDTALYTVSTNKSTLAWIDLPRLNPPALSHIVIRVPIFISNVSQTELFGRANDDAMRANCSACYRPDLGQKLWGFTSAVLNITSFVQGTHPQLQNLARLGYLYKLYRPINQGTTPAVLICQSRDDGMPLSAMLGLEIAIPNSQWFLYIYPPTGWHVPWRNGLLAAAVLVSFIAPLLLAFILVTRRQYELLLLSLVPRHSVLGLHQTTIDPTRRNNHAIAKVSTDPITGDAFITNGTPADKILDMMSQLLQGKSPPLQDIIMVRTALVQSYDLYAPIAVDQRIQDAVKDEEVVAALVALVGPTRANDGLGGTFSRLTAQQGSLSRRSTLRTQDIMLSTELEEPVSCGSMRTALKSIMQPSNGPGSPHPTSASNIQLDVTTAGKTLPHVPISLPQSLSMKMRSRGPSLQGRQVLSGFPATMDSSQLPDVCKRLDSMDASVADVLSLERYIASALSRTTSPPAPWIDEVERLLATAHTWTFNVFELEAATNGRSLSTLAFFLFSSTGLIKTFKIPPTRLIRYLKAVEEGYGDVNPYHSRMHAADVLQSLHVTLHNGGMVGPTSYADDLTLMTCYLAAVVHDFEHKGHTNDFLVNSGDPLALTYNDKSPLENHHLAAASKLMLQPDLNFLSGLHKHESVRLRKMLIELVLATDMKQHFSIVSQFVALHRLSSSGGNSSSRLPILDVSTPAQAQTRQSSASHTKIPIDDNERLLSLQMALKLSDLGHLAAPLAVHLRWVRGLEEEFFRQGDKEKACNLPISPLFDRSKPGVTKSQVGFFDFVVLPSFQNFTLVFSGTKPALKAVTSNYRYWKSQVSEALPAPAPISSAQSPASSEPVSQSPSPFSCPSLQATKSKDASSGAHTNVNATSKSNSNRNSRDVRDSATNRNSRDIRASSLMDFELSATSGNLQQSSCVNTGTTLAHSSTICKLDGDERSSIGTLDGPTSSQWRSKVGIQLGTSGAPHVCLDLQERGSEDEGDM